VILFIGSNPSVRSVNTDAFDLSTRSGRILASWIRDIEAPVRFLNISDIPTPNNRPLTKTEITAALPSLKGKIESLNPTHIVALGKVATRALTTLNLRFYAMEHPSGMNRKLNDKLFVTHMLAEFKQYVKK
jgi:uracil-DNA glycosylase family 4